MAIEYDVRASTCRTKLEPMNPAPPVTRMVPELDSGPLRVLQRELQLLRQRFDSGAAALPGAVGLETEIADAAAPRRNDAPDRTEVGAIRMLLIEPADDVRSHADERAQRRRRLDAVLAAVPRGVEHDRDLLEVVDEEFSRLFVRVGRPLRIEDLGGEQLLQFLSERRLRHPAVSNTEQLDLAVKRRILAIVQRPHDVVCGGQRFITI